jgi:cytidylate kinase
LQYESRLPQMSAQSSSVDSSPTLPPVIAIDGPSASGKGAVAARVAAALGFHYLDSGAIYRVAGLVVERAQFDPAHAKPEDLADLVGRMPLSFDGPRVMLASEDVSDAIRSEECGRQASVVAALPLVRQALLERQRAFRRAPGLVADGRDMGSVVFPDACLKVFLTASAEVRAERRHKQLMDKGLHANIAQLLQDIRRRDERDSSRAAAPLQKAAGAYELDTSSLSIDHAVAWVLERYEQHKRI